MLTYFHAQLTKVAQQWTVYYFEFPYDCTETIFFTLYKYRDVSGMKLSFMVNVQKY